ncbi:MAG: DUF488 domain-containing protein [Candidatus Latescibacteria bacterium]|nr:DUF488 domain-containing protein [Candidatus Latescibacterota bacterium]
MNSREKILLALLESFGGDLPNTDMQKYLFLLCQERNMSHYQFVPYKYGCFSFQAYNDKRKLSAKGILVEGDKWRLADGEKGYIDQLSFFEKNSINRIKDNFCSLRGDSLIRYVYRKYPFYAINSEIVTKLMNKDEQETINRLRPKNQNMGLYTIGYEGRSLEEFLNVLIKVDVKLLCDVRKNPISRKYGFSKKTLQNALESVGIKYCHFPEVGINSDKRKNLKNLYDYKILFKEYERNTLRKANDVIETIYHLLIEKKRIALTCFEKDPNKCHRTLVAKAVTDLDDNEMIIRNL